MQRWADLFIGRLHGVMRLLSLVAALQFVTGELWHRCGSIKGSLPTIHGSLPGLHPGAQGVIDSYQPMVETYNGTAVWRGVQNNWVAYTCLSGVWEGQWLFISDWGFLKYRAECKGAMVLLSSDQWMVSNGSYWLSATPLISCRMPLSVRAAYLLDASCSFRNRHHRPECHAFDASSTRDIGADSRSARFIDFCVHAG